MWQPPRPVSALSRGPTPSFTRLAGRYLEEYLDKIRAAVEQLDHEQLWWRPDETSNSVGNLLLHLTGSLSFWILVGLGGLSLARDRDAEFTADRTAGGAELLSALDDVVVRSRTVIDSLGNDSLASNAAVTGQETNALGALFHAVEHTAYHTGQILYIAKLLTGRRRDLPSQSPDG